MAATADKSRLNINKKISRGNNYSRRSKGAGLGGPFRLLSFFFKSALFVCFVCLVSLSSLYGYRWVTSNDFFGLKDIQIKGTRHLSVEQIYKIGGIKRGGNVLSMNISAIQNKILANPWVQRVAVQRVLPDKMVVTVQERGAAYWVRKNDRLFYADSMGQCIAPVQTGRFASLPILETGENCKKVDLEGLNKAFDKRYFPFGVNDLAWLKFVPGNYLCMGLNESGQKIILGMNDLKSNADSLSWVWADLKSKRELKRMEKIQALGGKVWVEYRGQGEQNGKI